MPCGFIIVVELTVWVVIAVRLSGTAHGGRYDLPTFLTMLPLGARPCFPSAPMARRITQNAWLSSTSLQFSGRGELYVERVGGDLDIENQRTV